MTGGEGCHEQVLGVPALCIAAEHFIGGARDRRLAVRVELIGAIVTPEGDGGRGSTCPCQTRFIAMFSAAHVVPLFVSFDTSDTNRAGTAAWRAAPSRHRFRRSRTVFPDWSRRGLALRGKTASRRRKTDGG